MWKGPDNPPCPNPRHIYPPGTNTPAAEVQATSCRTGRGSTSLGNLQRRRRRDNMPGAPTSTASSCPSWAVRRAATRIRTRFTTPSAPFTPTGRARITGRVPAGLRKVRGPWCRPCLPTPATFPGLSLVQLNRSSRCRQRNPCRTPSSCQYVSPTRHFLPALEASRTRVADPTLCRRRQVPVPVHGLAGRKTGGLESLRQALRPVLR